MKRTLMYSEGTFFIMKVQLQVLRIIVLCSDFDCASK